MRWLFDNCVFLLIAAAFVDVHLFEHERREVPLLHAPIRQLMA
jgi:hypothetical protein